MNKHPLETLYNSLKRDNYDVPDTYESFARTLINDTNARRTLYNSLMRDNYDVPDNYDSFNNTLFGQYTTREANIAAGVDEASVKARTAQQPRKTRYDVAQEQYQQGVQQTNATSISQTAMGSVGGYGISPTGMPVRNTQGYPQANPQPQAPAKPMAPAPRAGQWSGAPTTQVPFAPQPNFVERYKEGQQRAIKDAQGKAMTHLLSYAEVDGKYIVYPNVQPRDYDNPNSPLQNYEGDSWTALNRAMQHNDIMVFTTEAEAREYTEHYKDAGREGALLNTKGSALSFMPIEQGDYTRQAYAGRKQAKRDLWQQQQPIYNTQAETPATPEFRNTQKMYSDAADKAWQKAEQDTKALREANTKKIEDIYNDEHSTMLGKMAMAQTRATALPIEGMAASLKAHDMEKMADDAWGYVADDDKEYLIDGFKREIMREAARSGGSGGTMSQEEAEKALREEAERRAKARQYQAMYDKAVAANAPKDVLDFLQRKIVEGNSLSKLAIAAARTIAGTRGDMDARAVATHDYGKGHRVADITGSVLQIATDPVTWAAGGVGKGAVKGATNIAERAAGAAATRRLAATKGGQLAQRMIGGSANFAAFEGLGNIVEQLQQGGVYNEETGQYEYSLKDVAKAAGHGVLLGGATGVVGGLVGNVGDKVFDRVASTAGKLAVRGGQTLTSIAAEGTIFAAPELISGEGNFDTWLESVELMAGFKLQHGLRALPGTMGRLMRVPESRAGFETRLRDLLQGRPDLALTNDEREELERGGYTDLSELAEAYKGIEGKLVRMGDEMPYDRFSQLMADNSISEAARAKMYYYVTGRGMVQSTVTAAEIAEHRDHEGDITDYVVKSYNKDGGVITSRTYKSKKAAEVEFGRLTRQSELNSIDMLEKLYDRLPGTDATTAKMLRDVIGRESGIDIDKVIGKEENRRTDEEKAALQDYLNTMARECQDAWDRQHVDVNQQRLQPDWQEAYDMGYNADEQQRSDISIEREDNPNDPQAQAAWQGVEDRIRQDAADRADQRRAEGEKMAYKGKGDMQGMLRPLTINEESSEIDPQTGEKKKKTVYLVNGTIAIEPNGNGLSREGTDKTIYVYDPETGEAHELDPFGGAGVLSVGDVVSMEDYLANNEQQSQAEVQQEIDNATGKVNVATNTPFVTPEGRQGIVKSVEGENVIVQFADGEMEEASIPLADLQQFADALRRKEYEARHPQQTATEQPQQPNTATEGQAPTAQAETPTEGGNATEDTRTPAQRTYDDVVAKLGADRASKKIDATAKVKADRLTKAQKALKTAQETADNTEYGSKEEQKAEEAVVKAQAEYDAAQQDMAAWDEVRKLRDQALLAQSEAEDAARKAELERKRAEETEAQRKRREEYEADEARRKAEAEAAEKRRQEENERLKQQAANPQPAEQPAPIEGTKGQASQLAIARQELADDPEALAMLDETEPRTLVEVAATLLASGKNATKLLREDFKRETGYSDADVKRYPFLFAGADKGGITLARFGEMVVEAAREYGVLFDENDATAGINAALELLGGVGSQADINDYIINSRIAEAYDYHNAALAAARARMLEAYGMTEGEYESYMSWLEDAIEQGKSTLSDEEFNQIFNVYEQGQTTDAAGGNQEGAETTERTESAETDVSQNGERGNGETDAGTEQAAVSKYEEAESAFFGFLEWTNWEYGTNYDWNSLTSFLKWANKKAKAKNQPLRKFVHEWIGDKYPPKDAAELTDKIFAALKEREEAKKATAQQPKEEAEGGTGTAPQPVGAATAQGATPAEQPKSGRTRRTFKKGEKKSVEQLFEEEKAKYVGKESEGNEYAEVLAMSETVADAVSEFNRRADAALKEADDWRNRTYKPNNAIVEGQNGADEYTTTIGAANERRRENNIKRLEDRARELQGYAETLKERTGYTPAAEQTEGTAEGEKRDYNMPLKSLAEVKRFMEEIGYNGSISATMTTKDGRKFVKYRASGVVSPNIYFGETTPRDILQQFHLYDNIMGVNIPADIETEFEQEDADRKESKDNYWANEREKAKDILTQANIPFVDVIDSERGIRVVFTEKKNDHGNYVDYMDLSDTEQLQEDIESVRAKAESYKQPKQEPKAEKEEATEQPKADVNEKDEQSGKGEKVKNEAAPKQKIDDVGEKIGGARKDLAQKMGAKINLDADTFPKMFPKFDLKKAVEQGLDPKLASSVYFLRIGAQKEYKSWLKHSTKGKALSAAKFFAAYAKQFLENGNTSTEFKDNRWTFTEYGKKHIEYNLALYEKVYEKFGNALFDLDLTGYEIKPVEKNKWNHYYRRNEQGKEEEYQPAYEAVANYSSKYYEEGELDKAIDELVNRMAESVSYKESHPYKLSHYYMPGVANSHYIGVKLGGKVVALTEKMGDKETSKYLKEHEAELQEKAKRLDEERKQSKQGGTNTRWKPELGLGGGRARVGNDYRNGKDVSAEDFRKTFGFRGVEFGNYVTQAERQRFINEAYDAMMDLAALLNVSPRALSLGGRLGFAIGARGGGNAMAHYEPDLNVINLTKSKGAGSLAHEWWHALDYYFNRMGDRRKTPATANRRAEDFNPGQRREMEDAFVSLMEKINSSDYRKRSVALDAALSKDYYTNPTELGARAFQDYVQRRLTDKGQVNDFLSSFTPEEQWNGKAETYPYPTGKDADAIDERFDSLFGTMLEREDEQGNVMLYERADGKAAKVSAKERKLRDAVVDLLRKAGIEVIMDEEAWQRVQNEEGKKPMLTKDGEVYGFTMGGRIYLDPRIATAETPIHEYTHLWAAALRAANPKAWERLKSELEKDKDLMAYVQRLYPELKGDELMDEVFAHFSGRRGAERLRAEQERMEGETRSIVGKAKVIAMFENLRNALKKFWNMARDLFAGKSEGVESMSAEDFADMALADLVGGFNPRTSSNRAQFQFVGERGAAAADRAEEATHRLNNLGVARDMEANSKDAKTIKIATGWERGADGKWRYEIPDFEKFDEYGNIEWLKRHPKAQRYRDLLKKSNAAGMGVGEPLTKDESNEFEQLKKEWGGTMFDKPFKNENALTIEDFLEADELFKAYPILKGIRVELENEPLSMTRGGASTKRIKNTTSYQTAESKLKQFPTYEDYKKYLQDRLDKYTIMSVEQDWAEDDIMMDILGDIRNDIAESREQYTKWKNTIKKGNDISEHTILINTAHAKGRQIAEVLVHEIQHIIQEEEGFAIGGNVNTILKENASKEAYEKVIRDGIEQQNETINILNESLSNDEHITQQAEWEGITKEEYRESLIEAREVEQKDLRRFVGLLEGLQNGRIDKDIAISVYIRIAGEVEARNATARMNMTPEERRNSLAAETEDVSRDDQIFLYEGNGERNMEIDSDVRFRGEEEPVFYSNAMRAVENIKQERATPEQWVKMIEKQGGMKAGEDKWLGLSEWLKGSEAKTLTKGEVLDYIRANEIQIEEVEYGETDMKDGLETFLRDEGVPSEDIDGIMQSIEAHDGSYAIMDADLYDEYQSIVDKYVNRGRPINSTRLQYTTEGLDNKREIVLTVPGIEPWNENDEVHFGEAGGGRAVAWVRFGETTDADGKRVLVIDEIQSKRHQEGREKGYRKEITYEDYEKAQEEWDSFKTDIEEKYHGYIHDIMNSGQVTEEEKAQYDRYQAIFDYIEKGVDSGVGVPDAPFEKNWHEVAMKRMLRFAAENGYDKVAWTTGEQQAERYDLGGLIDHIDIYPHVDNITGERVEGEYEVFPVDKRGNTMMAMTEHPFSGNLTADEVLQYYGKDLGTRMMQAADKAGNDEKSTIEGEGLRIGGEGMKGFYDQILPRFMDKYGKKWGVKTGEVELPNIGEGGLTMWSVDVTDDMRESVMRGQPLFRPKTQSREGGEEAYAGEWYDRGSVERIGEFVGYTPKQIAKMNARQEQSARNKFRDAAEKLHLGDTITFADSIDDVPGLTDKQRRDWRRKKGWYSPRTGKIVIILGNHRSMDDVMKSILHEGVAHHGLRQMFGKHFDTFLDNVYRVASPEIRDRINTMAKKHGWDFRTATEEYLAMLAEDTDFEKPENQSWWKQVKDWFIDMLHKIGFKLHDAYDTITDNELRYVLWRSYQNLVNPGRFNSVVEEAKDIAKQYDLKVGQWDETWTAAEAEPNATIEYNGRRVPIWATNGRRGNRADRVERNDSTERDKGYEKLKKKYPEHMIVKREGDFYLIEGEDAKKAANLLGEVLVKHKGIDAIGFPTYMIDEYLPKLVKAGVKVAVADNVAADGVAEDAAEYAQRDAEYMEAVTSGDMEKAQRMVDEAAKRAMPDTKIVDENGNPLVVYHGSPIKDITTFDKERAGEHTDAYGDNAIYTTDSESVADVFSHEMLQGSTSFATKLGNKGKVYPLFLGMKNPFDLRQVENSETMQDILKSMPDIGNGAFFDSIMRGIKAGNHQYAKQFLNFDKLKELGYDGIIARMYAHEEGNDALEYGAFSPSQIKSADPVTYDDNGNVIPLSERFNEGSDDIRFRDGEDEETGAPKLQARGAYERMVSSAASQWKEAMQDSMLSLKKLYQAVSQAYKGSTKGVYRIEDEKGYENAYLAENRMHSMSEAQIHAYQQDYMKPLQRAIHALTGGKREAYETLTDYMMAKHGLERNEVMAKRDAKKAWEEKYKSEQGNPNYTAAKNAAFANIDAGVDDLYLEYRKQDYAGLTALTGIEDVEEAEKEAQRMVDEYEQQHDTTDLWIATNRATRRSLFKMLESGLLSPERHAEIRDMYQYYIPLQGFDSDVAEDVYAYMGSDGTRLYGTTIRAAKGRKSKADDPIATIAMNGEAAIRRGNRNLMKQHFLRFVQSHPSDLVSINDVWLRKNANGEWEQYFDADLKETDTPEEVARKVRDFNERMEQEAAANPDLYKRSRELPNVPFRVLNVRDMEQHQVMVQVDGKNYMLTINGNPRAAQALNGLTNPDVLTAGFIGTMMNATQSVVRTLSQFYTTRNPNFVLSNFLRDAVYTNSMVLAKESPNYALNFHKNFLLLPNERMGVLFASWENGKLREKLANGTASNIEKMFYDFMMNGGETGWTSLRDIEKHKRDLQKALKREGNIAASALNKLGDFFDITNRMIENHARFTAYVTSIEMGRSVERAVWDAKEISVNFNKKGAGDKFLKAKNQTFVGKVGAFISGLGRGNYAFWNASLQGLNNIARIGKRNPAKFMAVATTLMGLGVAIPLLNALLGGDDDDDKNAYWNLPEYVRRSNICFRFTKDMPWITIPLPIEFRAIYGLGELGSGVALGKEHYSKGELTKQVAAQFSQVLPLDFMEGGGGWHCLYPTYIKPVIEAYSNQSWTGLPIYRKNTYGQYDVAPEWQRAYSNTNNQIMAATKWLNEATGGDEVQGGNIDFNPARIEYMLRGYLGGYFTVADQVIKMGETATGNREFEWRNMMLANRVVKEGDERTEARKLTNEYFNLKEEYDKTDKSLKAYKKKQDEGTLSVVGQAHYIALMNDSEEYGRYLVFGTYKPLFDAYYKQIKEANAAGDSEEAKRLERGQNELRREMVNIIHDMDNGGSFDRKKVATGINENLKKMQNDKLWDAQDKAINKSIEADNALNPTDNVEE